MKKAVVLVFICISICVRISFAQGTPPDSAVNQAKDSTNANSNSNLKGTAAAENKSHFQIGLSYMNDNVYLGRKDSTAVNYFNPTFGYYHKSGWHIQASLGYIHNNMESRVDLFTLEAGYEFTKGNYEGEVTASKFYYSSQSTNVNSEIKASVEYTNGYDFGPIKPSLDATWNISSKSDYAVGFGLEHSFSAFNDDFEIIPKALMNASTQNFYNDYYRNRRYSLKRKGQKPIAGVAAIYGEVQDPDQFKILDYEFSAEINYTLGKWAFNFTPTYAIPVNPSAINVTAILQNGTQIHRTKVESLENTFFWSLGVTLNL